MKSSRRADALVILALLLLPLLWFAPQALGGKTLLPADNLYQYPPWQSYAAQLGVTVQNGTVVPYNGLISDLVLENAQWKSLITDALKSGNPGDILWNPRLFAGVPFFAAGQHSAAYPLSLLFYILPLWRAYGVFTWIQLGLAAACMYVFMRVLGVRRPAGALAGITYAFSGFFITSVNFTMIIAAAAWLPLLLACIEVIVRQVEYRATNLETEGDTAAARPRPRGWGAEPFVALGGVVLLIQVLAGHIEITYYTLLVAAFYTIWRLARAYLLLRRSKLRAWPSLLRTSAWIMAMVVLGLALGGVQLLPLYELVKESFREGSASLQQVRDWAWPSRQIFTFILPDFFGNPTHHAYFDIWRREWVTVTQNALGQPLYTIDWGVKNYVEGANYLGIATLVMAVLGAVAGIRKLADPARRTHTWFFAVLAVLSMLFAFGTPLYAILYYGLPGYSQLHSAFRWVFPYTLAMAALAGFGLDWLLRAPARGLRLARIVGWTATVVGAASLAVVLLSLLRPEPFIALGEKLLYWPFWSDLATTKGFSNGAMFWSYEALQIARFGLIAVLAGVAILLLAGSARRGASSSRASRFFAAGLLGVLILDLWLVGSGFNPAVNPDLLKFTPPALEFLQGKQDATQPWRLTSLDPPDQKVLNANSALSYGVEDIRGYDSIIPKQYVAYMQRIQPQTELLYNRIAPIYSSETLDNPLLSLLGARYVVSTQTIPNDGYKLVYDDEVKVYENTKAQGRAFMVPEAVAVADQTAALDKLQQVSPDKTVVIEGLPQEQIPPASAPGTSEVRMSQRESRQYFVDVNTSAPGWLVLTDNFFDGWKAYLRPFGAEGEGVNASGDAVEEQLPIYRADGTFRAVHIPAAGQWTVRFVYSPRSLLLGAYLTFLAGVTLLLLLAWWAWGRFYKGESSEVGTVAKNSAVQVVMNLFNRGIDFAFAMLRLRVLSPEGEGSYVFAITFYLILEIVTRFGLGTLLTRDVAFEKDKARKYLANVLVLRSGLWLLTLPVTAVVLYFFQHSPTPLTQAEVQTIAFFVVSLFFANIADALSSVFMAFEKMEYPAATATAVTLGKVALSALVLLPPLSLGFVGLAAVAIFMNVVQVVWLWILLEQKVLRPFERGEAPQRATAIETQAKVEGALPGTHMTPGRVDWTLQRYMMRESWPLMINHLLATVFWRISQLVLRGAISPAAVGIFSAGIKYVDGLNVIPAYFTTAIFPLMSRYAHAGNDAFLKAYKLALQLLFMVALPIAVFFTFAATQLIQVLGGAAYLPDSAIALRLMIWSIPIGYLNSVTQYTLIAAKQQRFITRAFAIAVTATTIANLVLVPRYGAIAASALMILAEASLFLPFSWAVHRYIGDIPWVKMLGRPLLATGANLVIVWGLDRLGVPGIVSLAAGFAAYVLLLLVLGAFRGEEFAVLRNIITRRLRRPAPEPTA